MSARPYIAVVGPGTPDADLERLAEEVGRGLAERGAVVVCGGLGGVMAAACRGAKAGGGTTVGILPGTERGAANPWVDVAVATGLGEARNVLVVRAADALIAVGGGFGTLSEIAFALKTGTPVVGIGTWRLARGSAPVDAVPEVASPGEAVGAALTLAAERSRSAGVHEGPRVRAPSTGET